MKAMTRRVVVGVAAIAMSASLAACGQAGGDSKGDDDGKKLIGLLLPENKTTRYEAFDRPLITKKIEELCSDCEVKYNNASQDTQQQKKQFDALVTQGADVIILDAVDATATKSWVDGAVKQGIEVVAYDRLAEGDISGYVSYDNEAIGKLQGEAMVEALGDEAKDARVVMINGSPTDPNAALFKKGAHSVLDEKVKEIVYEQDIPDWSPDEANKKMSAAITSLGKDGFDAVYSANDGMAGGIITALQRAGIDDVPVGGQDSELAGVQRIVKGEQAFTIYKAIKPEAETAAQMAVALLEDKSVKEFAPTTVDSKSKKGIPSKLYGAKVVTQDNIEDTLVADEVYEVDEICTKAFKKACEAAGLK
jgi:D-xylose transport system substrate-binding protein